MRAMTQGRTVNPERKAVKENDDGSSALFKFMLKGSMAAAAPGFLVLVMAFTMPPSTMPWPMSLGALGSVAAALVVFGLAHLLFRGHWWAGMPTLSLCGWAAWVFGAKFVRPMNAYLVANPVEGVSDMAQPLMLVGPALVGVLFGLTLGWAVWKTMMKAREIGPQPVNRHVWSMLIIWTGLLVFLTLGS